MELFSDLLGDVDFTDSRVKILFIAGFLLILLVVGGIFCAFKLFIPKSKMRDEQAIGNAINRLQKLMLFDKIALCVSVALLLILGALHFTKVIDLFQSPFHLLAIASAGITPIFIVAVFGVRGGISSNQRKLEQLKQLERDLKK